MTDLFTELSTDEACALLERFHISRDNDKPSLDFASSSCPDTKVLLPPSYFSDVEKAVGGDQLLTPADFGRPNRELLTPSAILAQGKRSRDESDCVYPDFLFSEPLPKRSLVHLDDEFEDMWQSNSL